jgi:hypothetical protein
MSLSIHFINQTAASIEVIVCHAGCAGMPWRAGKPQCWSKEVKAGGPNGVYVPSGWVTDFSTWLDLIVQGGSAIILTGAAAITAGATAPAAGVQVAAAVTDATAIATDVVGTAAGEGIELTSITTAVSTATATEQITTVAAEIGMQPHTLVVLARAVSGVMGAEAIGISVSVAFTKLTAGWDFYYKQNGVTYKADASFQQNGDFIFVIGADSQNLWKDTKATKKLKH